MGIILSAMAAAGDAGVQSMNQNIQQMNLLEAQGNQSRLETERDAGRSDLELQKLKAIEDYKNAPTARAGELIRASAGEQIPVQADTVSKLSGADPESKFDDGNGPTVGMVGDYDKLKEQIGRIPDAGMRAEALAQLDRQRAADQSTAQSAVDGKTRARTPVESLSFAYNRAIENGDMQAAAAIKSASGEKFTVIPDGASYLNNQTGELKSGGSGKDERQQAKEEAADARLQKRLDAQMEMERMREGAKISATRAAADPWGVFSGSGPAADGTPPPNLPHGEEFLKMIPPQAQEQVKALAEGRLSFPTGAAMRSPAAQNLIAAVAQYDPSFDAVNYSSRAATRKDFTSGKAATSVNAINTVMKHLDEYIEAGNALDNSSFKAWNYLGNKAIDAKGDPRVTRFNTTRNAVVDEVEKAYRGSGGSQAGIEAWKENMSSSQSPDQIKASGTQLIRLLEGKMEALGDQYSKGMGVTKNGFELLSPSAQKVYNKLMNNGAPADGEGGAAKPSLNDIFGK